MEEEAVDLRRSVCHQAALEVGDRQCDVLAPLHEELGPYLHRELALWVDLDIVQVQVDVEEVAHLDELLQLDVHAELELVVRVAFPSPFVPFHDLDCAVRRELVCDGLWREEVVGEWQ